MEAKFYTPSREGSVLCDLCPHRCLIFPGRAGKCRVRTNRNGILYADTYECLSATHFDPIEKKPLYNFFPGTEIFSLGSLGCSFKCSCCQNYEISQNGKTGFPRVQEMAIDEIIHAAKSNPANIGIAYTYNEPFVWYEYMYDIAEKAKASGLKNVVVSNGYINPDPLDKLIPFIDAFNIDLKSFHPLSYKEFAGGELPYIKNTLTRIIEAGKHLEITMLIIPGFNDDLAQFGSMLEWIRESLGKSVPLHLSRYFPQFKLKTPATSIETLKEFAELAQQNLDYVYLGNVPSDDFQNTYCPECGHMVIRRQGYFSRNTGFDKKGNCSSCGHNVVISG